MNKAVVLTSGGLDSTTVLSIALKQNYLCHCLSFNYGQRNVSELNAITKVIGFYPSIVEHKVFKIDLTQIGGSSLTDNKLTVPKANQYDNIPNTYVPARNTIFLSIALSYAEKIQANKIFIGVNAVDYSNYPDCRPQYINAYNQLAPLAIVNTQSQNPMIETPLIYLTKAEIIKIGIANGVDYSLTVSCYNAPDKGEACGQCDSCYLRQKGFAEAGVDDPTVYRDF